MEDVKLKSSEQVKDDRAEESTKVGTPSKEEVKEVNEKSKPTTSSSAEQDLDVFLLGDPGDSDDGPGT